MDDHETLYGRRYPDLHRFFDACFHQDRWWSVDGDTPEGVFVTYARAARPAIVRAVLRQLADLAAEDVADDDLRQIMILQLGCFYNHGCPAREQLWWARAQLADAAGDVERSASAEPAE